jgi:hypothetical protein
MITSMLLYSARYCHSQPPVWCICPDGDGNTVEEYPNFDAAMARFVQLAAKADPLRTLHLEVQS